MNPLDPAAARDGVAQVTAAAVARALDRRAFVARVSAAGLGGALLLDAQPPSFST